MGKGFDELKKALTTSGDGAALVPANYVEAALYEELLGMQPLLGILGVQQSEGLTHEYRIRTSHPKAWFEGETTGPNNKAGAYERKTVQMKIQRIWGSVTGFAQKVDAPFINALATELNGSALGFSDLMEWSAIFGAADDIGFTGDAYQYSGILPRMYAYAPENVIDAGGAKITLDYLDQALAKAFKHRQTRQDPGVWTPSLRMKQVIDGLQAAVNLDIQTVALADGRIEMSAYGGKGLLESDMVTPESTSPACTASKAAGGTLTAGDYKYKISMVTFAGEQLPGTASATVTTETTNLKANLTWTHDDNALQYMIWRSPKDTVTEFYLLDIIPALTYDANGLVNGVVESYSDTGAKSLKTQIKPLASGKQVIPLFNTSPIRGARFVGQVDDMGRQIDQLVSFVELARVKDSYDYMLKSYHALKFPYPNLGAVIRNVATA